MSIGISFFKKFKNTHVCKSCNVLEAELGDSGCRMPYTAASPSEGVSTCPSVASECCSQGTASF